MLYPKCFSDMLCYEPRPTYTLCVFLRKEREDSGREKSRNTLSCPDFEPETLGPQQARSQAFPCTNHGIMKKWTFLTTWVAKALFSPSITTKEVSGHGR